jgi:hypothetical protein
MFSIGTQSDTVATGVVVATPVIGRTWRDEGVMPIVHCIIAPDETT